MAKRLTDQGLSIHYLGQSAGGFRTSPAVSRHLGGAMIKRSISARFALMVTALAFTSVEVSAQTATEYSDKDKQKLAAIAQRPDVQKLIADTWDNRRRE